MTRTRILTTIALVLAAPLLLASGTLGGMRDYVFVFIKTGPETELSAEARQEAFAGHFSNMKQMAEEGKLLIAGPLGAPKSDPDHRGLFVLNTKDHDTGMEWASTDPTTKLGVFVLEGFTFTTDAPLPDLPRLDKEEEAQRLADPDIPDAWEGRMYMLATAPYSEQLHKQAANTDGILISGRLHKSAANGGDQVLVWVNALDEPKAAEILPTPDAWTLHGWYGSKMVAEMGG